MQLLSIIEVNTSQNGSTLLKNVRGICMWMARFQDLTQFVTVGSMMHDAGFDFQNPLRLKVLRTNEQH